MYLNTHTYYSLRYGTISPENLLEIAQKNGISSFAITDINTTSACLNILREANSFDIKPIFGIDFRNGINQLFIAIAKNNDGFEEINQYLTPFLINKTVVENGIKEIPETAPEFKNAFVIYPYQKAKHYTLRENEFIGISPTDLDYFRIKKIDSSKTVILQTVSFKNKKDFKNKNVVAVVSGSGISMDTLKKVLCG